MTSHTNPVLAELDQIRLDDDLGYAALASRIGVSESLLYRALNGTTEPRDRTLHKMRKFLAARKNGTQRKGRAS